MSETVSLTMLCVCVQAVVTALQSVHQCSRQDAETMFAQGVVWTQEEFDSKWQQWTIRSAADAARRSS